MFYHRELWIYYQYLSILSSHVFRTDSTGLRECRSRTQVMPAPPTTASGTDGERTPGGGGESPTRCWSLTTRITSHPPRRTSCTSKTRPTSVSEIENLVSSFNGIFVTMIVRTISFPRDEYHPKRGSSSPFSLPNASLMALYSLRHQGDAREGVQQDQHRRGRMWPDVLRPGVPHPRNRGARKVFLYLPVVLRREVQDVQVQEDDAHLLLGSIFVYVRDFSRERRQEIVKSMRVLKRTMAIIRYLLGIRKCSWPDSKRLCRISLQVCFFAFENIWKRNVNKIKAFRGCFKCKYKNQKTSVNKQRNVDRMIAKDTFIEEWQTIQPYV